jgi:acetyl esterase/lipase
VVCQQAKQNKESRIALQVLLCTFWISMPIQRRHDRSIRDFLNKATIEWMISLYCPSGIDRSDPRLSPSRAKDVFRPSASAYPHR